MKLQIISPQKQEEYVIAWIEINTLDGNFILQPGYATTTFVLMEKEKCIFCLKTGKQESFTPKEKSILTIKNNTIKILLTG